MKKEVLKKNVLKYVSELEHNAWYNNKPTKKYFYNDTIVITISGQVIEQSYEYYSTCFALYVNGKEWYGHSSRCIDSYKIGIIQDGIFSREDLDKMFEILADVIGDDDLKVSDQLPYETFKENDRINEFYASKTYQELVDQKETKNAIVKGDEITPKNLKIAIENKWNVKFYCNNDDERYVVYFDKYKNIYEITAGSIYYEPEDREYEYENKYYYIQENELLEVVNECLLNNCTIEQIILKAIDKAETEEDFYKLA